MVAGGKIYLFRDGIAGPFEARRTIWHELFHYGIRRFLTPEQYIRDMQGIALRDPALREQANAWKDTRDGLKARRFAEETKGLQDRVEEYVFARGVEEAMAAGFAEAVGPNASTYVRNDAWNRTLRVVRDWLARLADRLGLGDVAAWIREKDNREAREYVHMILGKLRNDDAATSDDWLFTADGAFQRRDLQSGDGLPENAPDHRTLDGAELAALRRAAAGLEAPERGITFRIEDDGRAILTGPARTQIPDRFRRFAEEHGLKFEVRRGPTDSLTTIPGESDPSLYGKASYGAAMPVEYRENGARYASEMGEPGIERTGRTRFVMGDEQSGERHTVSSLKSAIDAAWGAGFADRLEGTGRVSFVTSERIPGDLTGAAFAQAPGGEFRAPEVRNAEGRLLAPNGEPSLLTERQWHQVRSPEFKAWFGEWERAWQRQFLSGDPVINLTGSEFQKTDEPLTKRVAAWFATEHDGKANNPALGEVTLNERGVKDSIAHGLGREKAAAFAAVPAIIEHGKVIDAEKNWKGRQYDGYTLAAPVRIAGKDYVGMVIVHRDAHTQRFYLQEVALREALQRQPFETEASTGENAALNGGHAGAVFSLVQRIFGVNQDTVSKVTDANGEPLVVYHGTRSDISSFDQSKLGDATGARSAQLGFFFTDKVSGEPAGWMAGGAEVWAADSDGSYAGGGNIMPVYLSIKNPLRATGTEMGHAHFDEGGAVELRNKTEADGHDGVVYRDGGENWHIAFRPEQIKSSIGNTGTFSPANADIRYSRDGRPLAWVKDGHITFVADHIGQGDDVKGLTLHEIGVHALQLGRSDAEFQGILQRLHAMRTLGNPQVREAYARVPGDTPAVLADEEALGYLVHAHPDLPIVERVIARFRAQVRALAGHLKGAERLRFVKWANELTPADMVYMAQAATRRAPEDLGRDSQFSRDSQETGFAKASDHPDGTVAWTRTIGFPADAPILHDYTIDGVLKARLDYKAAKSGDQEAAARLVEALVKPETIEAAKSKFGNGVVYLPVLAQEALGKNAIPNALAHFYAEHTEAPVSLSVTQTNKAHHTGANAMERLIARSEFDGDVIPGRRYVLVDDVSTMGGTLADLSSYIQSKGGVVAGAVVLTNASRSGRMAPTKQQIRLLEERHGQAINELFGIEPSSLTHDEAQYLAGFRTTDELRNRGTAAHRERAERLLSKSVREGPSDLSEPRFARAQQTPPPGGVSVSGARPSIPKEDAARLMQRIVQDQMNRFTVIQEWLEEHGVTGIPYSNADVYRAEERMHGKIAARIEDFREQYLAPLVRRIHKAGFDMHQVAEYLHARHAIPRNIQIEKINPLAVDEHGARNGSGMTDAEAQMLLRALAGDGTRPAASTAQPSSMAK